jgi:hypothetical protein
MKKLFCKKNLDYEVIIATSNKKNYLSLLKQKTGKPFKGDRVLLSLGNAIIKNNSSSQLN